MPRTTLLALATVMIGLAVSLACVKPVSRLGMAEVEGVLNRAFAGAPATWASRFEGDETMHTCSASGNKPGFADAKVIVDRARASIAYPSDGVLLGDWKAGEAIAQSGYGLRFTDEPPAAPNGGNCYACHRLTRTEISYGTVGPSLLEYGALRNFSEAAAKSVYGKIYNSHATVPCSLMPRFGANGVLSVEQIRHLTALLMSPDSPVNK